MRKLILLLLLVIFFPSKSISQTRLKFNAPYWAFGITNISVETKLAHRWTFNSDIVVSPWKSLNKNPFLFMQLIAEGRYYLDESFKGFYVGGFAAFQLFKMSKWNYINTGKYQKGRGLTLGATVGYQIALNNRWSVDLFIGGGWQNSQYRGYYAKTGEQYVGWNGSGEWLPYKIGVSFGFKL